MGVENRTDKIRKISIALDTIPLTDSEARKFRIEQIDEELNKSPSRSPELVNERYTLATTERLAEIEESANVTYSDQQIPKSTLKEHAELANELSGQPKPGGFSSIEGRLKTISQSLNRIDSLINTKINSPEELHNLHSDRDKLIRMQLILLKQKKAPR